MDLIRHISSFCKKYSVLLAVALIACCATKSFAQTTSAPVQVNSQLTPPYSIYLSDYTNDALNKWPITLNLRDFTKSDYRVRLRITIESQAVRFRTKPSFMPQGMYLTPGVPTQVTYDKLAAYLNPNNMEMSGINPATFASSQQLPEGFYTFTIEVLDYQRGNVVSNTSRNIAWIVQNEPPLLNLPFEEKVRIQDPQQIQFQWTPRHTSSPNSAFETEYIFRLWEIWPAGRNPFEVVRTSNPVFEQRTNLNSYFYGPGDIPLIPGRSYAWQVQAVSNIGRDLFKNNGRSEVKSFQYGDECLTVTGVGLEALGPDRIKVDWTGDWNHSGYVVEVREKGTTDWTTYATNIETQVVFDLEAGTEYEVQVKSTCGVLTGVASDIISVSTLDASEIDFECGADPDNPAITNRDPIESLQIGDRIEALGFKVRITEITGAGPYNGKGAIEVPLFNLASVEADLVNIEVNTDRKLIGGYVETTLNPAGPFIVGLDSDELDEGEEGEETTDDQNDDSDIVIDDVIDDVDVDEDTGVITVTTEDGETTTIDPDDDDVETDEDGNIKITDSNGDTWVVGPDKTVTPPSESGDNDQNNNNSSGGTKQVNNSELSGIDSVLYKLIVQRIDKNNSLIDSLKNEMQPYIDKIEEIIENEGFYPPRIKGKNEELIGEGISLYISKSNKSEDVKSRLTDVIIRIDQARNNLIDLDVPIQESLVEIGILEANLDEVNFNQISDSLKNSTNLPDEDEELIVFINDYLNDLLNE
jgi:hypothetical protein